MDAMLFHMVYAKLDDFKWVKTVAFDNSRMWTSTGYALHYPNLRVKDTEYGQDFTYTGRKKPIKIYGAKLVENICQADCRNIVAYQGIEIAKRYQIVLLAHDEIVYLARYDEADEALAFGIAEMSKPPKWGLDIPVAATGYISPFYKK